MTTNESQSPSNLMIVSAFLAVYIIWGSTYLAIMFAVDSIQPFFMAGVRFIIAGLIMAAWSYFRGDSKPTTKHWKEGTIVGGLLLLGGNGAVVWAEQYIPSGITALIVTTTPFWMVLIDWIRPGGNKPGFPVVVGILLGFFGVALLINPDSLSGIQSIYLPGVFALTFAALAWAAGSVYSRHADLPKSQIQSTAIQLFTGGILLIIFSIISGEFFTVDVSRFTSKSLISVLYLITFGSIIGYTAYSFLLKNVSAAKVSTYAYVNPVVAVFLGWLIAGEPITGRVIIAAGVIISGVAFITVYKNKDSINISGFVGTVVRLPVRVARKVGSFVSRML